MSGGATFIMAGGGTGGHVIPSIAVARELAARRHYPVFVGTQAGFEARLVPEAGFPIEWIRIGGLNSVGPSRMFKTLQQLPGSFRGILRLFDRYRPAAVFSMGGYVAGPVLLAAWWRGLPVVVMEPNAIPGLTHRRMARFVHRALVSFPETAVFFPRGRSEVTGLPVRDEFFGLPPKPLASVFTILITGGSRGARSLNAAAQDSWSYFKQAQRRFRILHQTGVEACERITREFAATGLEGEVWSFLSAMPEAFAQADLVVCRSGAGAIAELAAAGKPSILIPFPFAADQHQLKNAEALERAGAARMVLDAELNGRRLFEEVEALASEPARLAAMGGRARAFAHPNAAQRAATVLEEAAGAAR